MIIRLWGGPLDGTIHEVAGGWPVPDRLGLVHEGNRFYYTAVSEDEAFYDGESEPVAKGGTK